MRKIPKIPRLHTTSVYRWVVRGYALTTFASTGRRTGLEHTRNNGLACVDWRFCVRISDFLPVDIVYPEHPEILNSSWSNHPPVYSILSIFSVPSFPSNIVMTAVMRLLDVPRLSALRKHQLAQFNKRKRKEKYQYGTRKHSFMPFAGIRGCFCFCSINGRQCIPTSLISL